MLRLAWIFGLISTRDYNCLIRQKKFGGAVVTATEAALKRMERSLVEDRIAVIVLLLAITLFLYTIEYAPAFSA
jgi:hypothetical protein